MSSSSVPLFSASRAFDPVKISEYERALEAKRKLLILTKDFQECSARRVGGKCPTLISEGKCVEYCGFHCKDLARKLLVNGLSEIIFSLSTPATGHKSTSTMTISGLKLSRRQPAGGYGPLEPGRGLKPKLTFNFPDYAPKTFTPESFAKFLGSVLPPKEAATVLKMLDTIGTPGDSRYLTFGELVDFLCQALSTFPVVQDGYHFRGRIIYGPGAGYRYVNLSRTPDEPSFGELDSWNLHKLIVEDLAKQAKVAAKTAVEQKQLAETKEREKLEEIFAQTERESDEALQQMLQTSKGRRLSLQCDKKELATTFDVGTIPVASDYTSVKKFLDDVAGGNLDYELAKFPQVLVFSAREGRFWLVPTAPEKVGSECPVVTKSDEVCRVAGFDQLVSATKNKERRICPGKEYDVHSLLDSRGPSPRH